METLPLPDRFHFEAATGWLMLQNSLEAARELDQVRAELQSHPDVLKLRWTIQASQSDWLGCLKTAQSLVDSFPDRISGWIHRAYALRRVKKEGLVAARDALLPAAELFPNEVIVAYNLACYCCQLGDLDQAREWLARTWERAARFHNVAHWQRMALADPDLEPLWPEIPGGPAGPSPATAD